MDVKSEIKRVLEADGGWLSRNAMLNRIEGTTEPGLTYALGKMVKDGELLRINGVNGFEYALPGTRLPNAEGIGTLRRLQASDVAPETLAARPKGSTPLETIPTRAVSAGFNKGEHLSAKEKSRAEEAGRSSRKSEAGHLRAAIAELLRNERRITGKEVSHALGCGLSTAHRYLNELRAITPRAVAAPSPAAQQVLETEPAPAPAKPQDAAQYALWSTGEFVIRRGDDRLVLSVEDTRQLVAYLDRMLLPDEVVAA